MQNNPSSNEEKFVPDEKNFSDRQNQNQPLMNLSKGQKIGVIFLAFFALLAVIMWIVQFRQSLTGNFNNPSASSQTGNTADDNRSTQLQSQDTDGDGLSDYDELNLYMTSPYLEDSDSDGFSDREEILSGNDPNCPVGKQCQTGSDNGTNSSADGTDSLNGLLNQSATGDNSVTGQAGDTNTVESIYENQIDPASLRQYLLDNGADKTMLDNISDEELVKAFAESAQNGASDTSSIESVLGSNPDPATLRQLLIDNGVDKTMLDQISDADLIKTFSEVLNEQ